MKFIPLSGRRGVGLTCLVDDADYSDLMRHKWYSDLRGYAYGKIDGRSTHMHRYLMKPTGALVVDHRDGNGLNNQRSNLRVCTKAQNLMNRGRTVSRNRSGYKGVVRVKLRRRADTWCAYIKAGDVRLNLGTYLTAEDAALAYDAAAVQLHGEYAKTNILWN